MCIHVMYLRVDVCTCVMSIVQEYVQVRTYIGMYD